MPPVVGIIGGGGIARNLETRIKKKDWKISWIGGRSSLPPLAERLKGVDLVFNAMSTLDDGAAAYGENLAFVSRDIPVVTCEKGSWAAYGRHLWQWRHLIDANAACGGGSELMRYVASLALTRVLIEVVLNASLNFLFSYSGSIDEACVAAQERHLLEPGEGSVLARINSELFDAMLKACVFVALVLSEGKDFLTPQMCGRPLLSEEELAAMLLERSRYRYVVSFTDYENGFGPQRHPGEFRARAGRWHIKGAFVKFSDGCQWSPDSAANAVNVIDLRNRPIYTGPGAGYGPTTRVMLNGAYRLLYG
jgi:hypothetical protein